MERATDRQIHQMTEAEYFAMQGVNSSQLRCLAIDGSWAYYHRYILQNLPSKDSPSIRLGKLLHLAMEFPDWEDRVYVMPVVDGRTKEGKAAEQAATEAVLQGNLLLVEQAEHDHIHGMVEAIYDNPEAESYLSAGLKEVVGTATCLQTGLTLKAKADLLRDDCLIDYKTTRHGTAEGFRRAALRDYGYHFQAEFYQRVFDRPLFLTIAVTTEPPYEAMVYEYSPPLLEEAASMNDLQLGRLAQLLPEDNPIAYHSEYWGARIELGYETLAR